MAEKGGNKKRKRKIIIIIGVCLILLSCGPNVEAKKTEVKDLKIDPEDFYNSLFWSTDKGDKIEVKVESNIPVDVYIGSADDYLGDGATPFPDYSDTKYSEKGVTSTSFTFTCPDYKIYILIISNPNNSTATVDFDYENVTEKEEMFSFFNIMSGTFIAVIIVVIILVYFLWYRKKKQQGYSPQQPQYPSQQNQPYPPPQPPNYPPKRPPY